MYFELFYLLATHISFAEDDSDRDKKVIRRNKRNNEDSGTAKYTL